MKGNRNIKLLIMLLIVTAVNVILFYTHFSESSSIDKDIFKISNQEKIDRIEMKSKKDKIHLKFTNGKWWVNEKYEADPQLITLFFASIVQVEPKRKLSTAQTDTISARINKVGVNVTLWEGENLRKEFYIVGNQAKTETYFYVKDQGIYLVTIPGYHVYLASVFELPESDWRDKRVFNFNWQNFKLLSASFPQQPKQNFTISLSDGLFGINEIAVTDTTKLSTYLESVFNFKVESFIPTQQTTLHENIFRSTPILKLTIQDIAQHQYTLDIYTDEQKNPTTFALMNGKERIRIHSAQAVQIMRGKEYFMMK